MKFYAMNHISISKKTWKELKALKEVVGTHDFNGVIKELIIDYYEHFKQDNNEVTKDENIPFQDKTIDGNEKIVFTE